MTADSKGGFVVTLAGIPGDVYTVVVADPAGNASDPVDIASSNLPPDPASVAPALDLTAITPLHDATAFLYSGPYPIQTGVAQDTIEAKRVALVRGKIMDRNNNPLPGVTITIKDHPEFGQTLSRADGLFDMAVNGGGGLTVDYQKEGFLPVQRQVTAPWQDYAYADDVVMIPLDPHVSLIDLNTNTSLQVAQSTLVRDADGMRRTTLLFPPGTTATMTLLDGTLKPLTKLHVRATEYTLGPNGPLAMPGPLPPASGYTYAVELSADEVLAEGIKVHGKDVIFNQTVYNYVENFLDIEIGAAVPSGYYDASRHAWLPDQDGVVLKILALEGGRALIDTDGDNQPDDPSRLDALGFTELELIKLATLYAPGQSLWRMPHTHFSTKDYNFPVFFPGGGHRH